MNTVNVSGKILNLTKTGNSNGTKVTLGTIGVYRQKDKVSGQAKYDNISFIGYGKIGDFLHEGDNVALTGNLNVYQKDVGLDYPINITQINVTHVDNFSNQSKPVSEINVTDNDLPF